MTPPSNAVEVVAARNCVASTPSSLAFKEVGIGRAEPVLVVVADPSQDKLVIATERGDPSRVEPIASNLLLRHDDV